MTVWEIYQYCNFITRKERSGKISPEEFNRLLPIVQMKYFKDLFGLPEKYTPGAPIPNKAWEITSSIKDSLRPFLVTYGIPGTPLFEVDPWGHADLPANYCHYGSFGYYYSNGSESIPVSIDVLTESEVNSRLSDYITRPTKRNPVVTIYSTFLQFYPIDLRLVRFTYLKYPNTPVLGYDFDSDIDDIVENDYKAVDIEFPESDHINICTLLLKEIGIHLKDSLLIQYSEQMKNQGV